MLIAAAVRLAVSWFHPVVQARPDDGQSNHRCQGVNLWLAKVLSIRAGLTRFIFQLIAQVPTVPAENAIPRECL